MARIPYSDVSRPEIADVADRIVKERGSLLHLYRMLLHSRPIADGWLYYLTRVRHECALPGALRELVIMRVAHINGAPYEAEQHRPIALREGLTAPQLDALADWEASDAFPERERAVLAYADAMTKHVHVPKDIFDAVAKHFDSTLLVELTATIAAYNMVSRFLEALEIKGDDDTTPPGA